MFISSTKWLLAVTSCSPPTMSNPLKIYLSTSFVGDLSYQASGSSVAGMAHTFITGRKTWKTSKGKSEAVWPSHIEAALFDALEKYRPRSSGDPRLLRRFPKRNRFISDHIKKVTGKVRTPKQVGSRLQQLRDTCQEQSVLRLLSRREFPPEDSTGSQSPTRSESPLSPISMSPISIPSLASSSTSTSPASSPFTSEFPDLFQNGLSLSSPTTSTYPDRTVAEAGPPTVLIDIVSRHQHDGLGFQLPQSSNPSYLTTFNFPTDGPYPSLTAEQHDVRVVQAGPLNNNTPSIKILCPNLLPQARSVFCIFFDDNLLYSEVTDLELLPGLDLNGHVQYSSKLIPRYWETVAHADELSRYTITQDVIKIASIEPNQTVHEAVLFSVSYRFRATLLRHSDYLPVTLHVPNGGMPYHLSEIPIYAPRPLLLDTANTLLDASAAQPCDLLYDGCSMAYPATSQNSPPDFLGVGEIPNLNFNYNW
ncbi:hypothetical protein FPV67DRAFT_586718 [Lyophyllum atratum]|nr:hypothetical protein FPV67DRAFT_586718 [Lyophyllum atratum]